MITCTVSEKMKMVHGSLSDYHKLARYHYRDGKLGPYKAIYVMRLGNETVGVIVYSMPAPFVELRNIATNGLFKGYDRKTHIALINKNIRTISRVIIEPRFRSLGLAAQLVSETMPLLNVRYIEAMAVMGHVNPFFERAGMKPYTAPQSAGCLQIKEALSLVGIEEPMLFDADSVQRKIEGLSAGAADFLEKQTRRFLQSYGKRRNMTPGLQRTRYVLSKLTERPVYYLWTNINLSSSLQEYRQALSKTLPTEQSLPEANKHLSHRVIEHRDYRTRSCTRQKGQLNRIHRKQNE